MTQQTRIVPLVLYQVVSEIMEEVVPILEDGTGPTEQFRWAELVIARNRGQAKWMTWKKNDRHYFGWMPDMPKIGVRKLGSGYRIGPRFVTDDPGFQWAWGA